MSRHSVYDSESSLVEVPPKHWFEEALAAAAAFPEAAHAYLTDECCGESQYRLPSRLAQEAYRTIEDAALLLSAH